ncbi:MAG: hypothetical protein ABI680_08290, partial [Chthoniobacteraceae bacterium]
MAGVAKPSNAVVIPADATDPVNIILESSIDLVTWTPALPGAYGGSTARRFFRVRAVEWRFHRQWYERSAMGDLLG